MTITYAADDEVTYYGDLPCTESSHHHGTVQAVEDNGSDQVLTVEFEDCGPGCTLTDHLPHRTQDILASNLPAAQ